MFDGKLRADGEDMYCDALLNGPLRVALVRRELNMIGRKGAIHSRRR